MWPESIFWEALGKKKLEDWKYFFYWNWKVYLFQFQNGILDFISQLLYFIHAVYFKWRR